MEQDWDVVIIRHARSTFNDGEEEYFRQYPCLDFEQCENDPEFRRDVLFSPKYVDCELSKMGKQQCEELKEQMKDVDVDVVLVSPLRRALLTALGGFENRAPIIVQPSFVQACRYSCDLGIHQNQLMTEFPMVDFSNMDMRRHWYLHKIPDADMQPFVDWQAKNPNATYKQDQQKVLDMLAWRVICESDQNMRDRANIMLQTLEKYRKKYARIALVTHYYTINSLITRPGEELSLYVENAKPIWTSLRKLMKLR